MTTDIAKIPENGALPIAVYGSPSEALARLAEWVAAADQAHALVARLVDTPFLPDSYRPRMDPRATQEQIGRARAQAVANGTAAVLQGISLGLDPLTALQQIYVVHGRPGMYTEIKVALVVSRGHEVWVEDLSDSRAVVCGRRAGSEHQERVVVTMDQARKAGWTSNQAYAKTPQDMLYARAAGRVCDRIAPDVLMGIASIEEIRDTIQATAGTGLRTVQPPRRRAAIPAAQPVEEPPLEDEAAKPEPGPAMGEAEMEMVGPETARLEPAMITPAQSRKLHAALRDSGRADRDAGLVYIAGIIDRQITSTKELSRDEASRVIEALGSERLASDLGQPAPAVEDGEGWPETAQPPDTPWLIGPEP